MARSARWWIWLLLLPMPPAALAQLDAPVRDAGPQPAKAASENEVTVAITPDRAGWGFRETITGSLVITNTGKRPAAFDPGWINSVAVQDQEGKSAPDFFVLGCILRDLGVPAEVVIQPGQQHIGRFSVYSDRMHDMRNGYHLKPGRWMLTYRTWPADGVRVICQPAPVEVTVKEGEYAGPRIVQVSAHGPNFAIVREDGTAEVFDGATGERHGFKRLPGYAMGWGWLGAQLVWSSNGRMVAFSPDRDGPIHVEALYGEPPVRSRLSAPKSLDVGPGGFSACRFSPDDTRLFCQTSGQLITMEVASGAASRTVSTKEIWPQISPDGSFGGAVHGALMRIVGHSGSDAYRVVILDLDNPSLNREVAIAGHGESPTLYMGVRGAILCDEFAHSAVFVSYDDGAMRELETEASADFAGESRDGSLLALAWPRSEFLARPDPTVAAIYRISDGSKLCTIRMEEPRVIVLLSDPPRIAALPSRFADDRHGAGQWCAETAFVYDALTGRPIKSIDLTPPPGPLREPFLK